MKKSIFKILTSCILATSMLTVIPHQRIRAEESKTVNDYIYGLHYNNQDVLTRNGEAITNEFKKGSVSNSGEFVVIEKVKRNLTNKSSDIVFSMTNENSVFPGAILKADQSFLENTPTLVSVKRAPLTLSIDLPGLTDSKIKVENPTASSVKDGVNTLLERWHTSAQSEYPSIAAKMQYDQESAYSASQLKVKFGVEFEKIGVPLKIDFGAVQSGEKQVEIVNFKQIYYTVNVDAPSNPSDFFASDVQVKDLVNKGVTSETPPVYVSNVSYGRSIYVKFETTNKKLDLKGAVNATIKGISLSPDAGYSKELKDVKVTAVVLGGSSSDASEVINGNIEDLKKIIKDGSNYSKKNPGVPISYKANFLKDNSQAAVHNSTDYIETHVTSYRKGYLTLNHRGGYITKYFVSWDEISYDDKGNEILEHKEWQENGHPKTLGFNETLELNGNVRNLSVKIMERTGLVWDKWRTIYNRKNIELVQKRRITHWGTTINPKYVDDVVND